MLVALIFGSMLALMALTRIPLGFILLLCGMAGIAMVHPSGLNASVTIAQSEFLKMAMNYQFSVLPLFLAMGVFVAKAGLADDLFAAANRWMGHFRGGLGMASIASCAGFAALSSNSAATTVVMGRLAVPVMREYKYADSFSAGTVAAGATLGLMIPPSGALIIYGLLTETALDRLFMAALIPAGLQVLFYLLIIALLAWVKPELLARGHKYSWNERLKSLGTVWGVLFLFLFIILGIFYGWFTATEAGGIGAGGSLLFAIARGKMTWNLFVECLVDTAKTATMIYFVAAGALVMNQFVNLAGVPTDVVNFIESMNLSPMVVVFCLLAFYLILGMFLDGFAMLFLTVPVVVPVVAGLGFDLVWWGIITIVVVELAMITPPVGINCFVLKSALPDVSLTQIYRGIMPFFTVDVLRLIFLALTPAAVLWLPSLMG